MVLRVHSRFHKAKFKATESNLRKIKKSQTETLILFFLGISIYTSHESHANICRRRGEVKQTFLDLEVRQRFVGHMIFHQLHVDC